MGKDTSDSPNVTETPDGVTFENCPVVSPGEFLVRNTGSNRRLVGVYTIDSADQVRDWFARGIVWILRGASTMVGCHCRYLVVKGTGKAKLTAVKARFTNISELSGDGSSLTVEDSDLGKLRVSMEQLVSLTVQPEDGSDDTSTKSFAIEFENCTISGLFVDLDCEQLPNRVVRELTKNVDGLTFKKRSLLRRIRDFLTDRDFFGRNLPPPKLVDDGDKHKPPSEPRTLPGPSPEPTKRPATPNSESGPPTATPPPGSPQLPTKPGTPDKTRNPRQNPEPPTKPGTPDKTRTHRIPLLVLHPPSR